MPLSLTTAALVFLGGGLGSLLRYLIVLLIKPYNPDFPLGTLAVNLAGCLLIGLLAGILHASPLGRSSNTWLLLAVGLLGGFTTFSSFAIETADLIREQRWGTAIAYVLISNLLGVVLALGGWAITNQQTSQ